MNKPNNQLQELVKKVIHDIMKVLAFIKILSWIPTNIEKLCKLQREVNNLPGLVKWVVGIFTSLYTDLKADSVNIDVWDCLNPVNLQTSS